MAQELEAAHPDESLLGEVVGDFFDRRARGEHPDLAEYEREYPELAGQLRRVLPALELVGVSLSRSGERLAASYALGPGSQRLGDFRIVREIGRGGMGVVYEAEQLSMGRQVALKVLPFAAMVQSQALKRFQNEVRAAAALSHEHIVQVYSVGEDRGVHFFAMQLVRGQSLAELIAELAVENLPQERPALSRERSSPGAERDSTRRDAGAGTARTARGREFFASAARLGSEAAAAIQHAHDQGIIHRDIKPGNLLLDAQGRLYVTDFGLARIEAEAGLTMTGDVVGTLRYMAPEQALPGRAVVDQRADIYSLGATLYELCALQPPFAAADRRELLQQIATAEPRPLRQFNRAVPVDLQTIVLKALSKEPGDRYQTAGELREDLERFLRQAPIRARRIRTAERMLRVVRRHAGIVAAALALLILVTAGLGVAFVVANQARHDAVTKGEELRKRHEQSNLILGHVNRSVDSMLERLASLPAGDATRQAIIAEEVAFYEELQKIEPDSQAARLQLALALHRIGHLQTDVGQWNAADGNLRKSIGLLQELAEDEPRSSSLQVQLCHAWMNLGRVQFSSRREQAAESFRRSLAHGDEALRLAPNDAGCKMSLALAHGQLALLQAAGGDIEQAKATHLREIELLKATVQAQPENAEYQIVLGAAHHNFASTLLMSDPVHSKQQLTAAIDTYEPLVVQHPNDFLPRSRLSHLLILDVMWHGSELPSADRMSRLRKAVALLPQDAETHFSAAWSIAADRSASLEELLLAQQWAGKAVQLDERQPRYWRTLGVVCYRQGAWLEALEHLDRAQQLNPNVPGWNAIFQAMCYERLGQHDRALAAYQRSTAEIDASAPNEQLTGFRREAAALLGLSE